MGNNLPEYLVHLLPFSVTGQKSGCPSVNSIRLSHKHRGLLSWGQQDWSQPSCFKLPIFLHSLNLFKIWKEDWFSTMCRAVTLSYCCIHSREEKDIIKSHKLQRWSLYMICEAYIVTVHCLIKALAHCIRFTEWIYTWDDNRLIEDSPSCGPQLRTNIPWQKFIYVQEKYRAHGASGKTEHRMGWNRIRR